MKKFKHFDKILKNGGVGVIPTDTIYGLAASALDKNAVERIYKIKKRNSSKPPVVVISSPNDLKLFGVKTNALEKKILSNVWPGRISIVFSCPSKKFAYLHRGNKTLAVRLPKNKFFIKFLKKTGPLATTSANPEGKLPAKNINEAEKYFKKKVDFYKGKRNLDSPPSTIIKIEKGKIVILRQGAAKFASDKKIL